MSRVRVELPSLSLAAREYVLDWILRERLGIEFEVVPVSGSRTSIVAPRGRIIVPEVVFPLLGEPAKLERAVERVSSLDLRTSAAVAARCGPQPLTVFAGEPTLVKIAGDYTFGWDILGASFCMLTQAWAWGTGVLDDHGRPDLRQSHASRHGYLQRPLADEYVELLRELLRLLGVAAKPREHAKFLLSCDVDFPLCPEGIRTTSTLRSFVGAMCRAEGEKAASALCAWLASRTGIVAWDSNWRGIKHISESARSANVEVEFFFIPIRTNERDGPWPISSEVTGQALRFVLGEGWACGMHPGYESMDSEFWMHSSASAFRAAISDYGTTVLRSRQHYLRFLPDTTPALLEAAGVGVDSSVGGAWAPGFVAGTCHSFRLFDVKGTKALRVREQPLIVMDASLIDRRYRRFSDAAAVSMVREIALNVQSVGGTLSVLWHNSRLGTRRERQLFRQVLAIGAGLSAARPSSDRN